MLKVVQSPIRISAFLTKEILEILRQPMLILVLILGPFLILLLFGLGFRNKPQSLRTLFVTAKNSGLRQRIEAYGSTLGPQLIFMGVTDNKSEAINKLLRGDVDLIVVVPADAYQTIQKNQQAEIVLYHDKIDPYQVDYVDAFGKVYVGEVNRRVLQTVIQKGQHDSQSLDDALSATQANATALQKALAAGNGKKAQEQQQQLDHNLNSVTTAVGATLDLLDGIQQTIGTKPGSQIEDITTVLSALHQDSHSLAAIAPGQADYSSEINRTEKVKNELGKLKHLLSDFQQVDPHILVSPFRSKTEYIRGNTPQPSKYFIPAVIGLLLQHLALTSAALSIVQESRKGTIELFQAAPVSAVETLLGKYLSYFIFSGLVAVLLTALTIYGLGAPMLGNWLNYSLSLAALIFASLGLGFVISLIAKTDSQAVQYSMILLLASVFFSGALLSLQTLSWPVQAISWILPATYGIRLLQNIMLRGTVAKPILLLALSAIGLSCFLAALWLLRRRLAMH